MYVSDLKRVAQTVQEINETLGLTPIITAAIREVNAGRGNGQTREWYNSNKKVKSDCFEDISKRRFRGAAGSVSKITLETDGRVVAHYINQRVCYV